MIEELGIGAMSKEDLEVIGLTEGAEEQLRRNHSQIAKFLDRLDKAPNCKYIQMQINYGVGQ